MLASLLFHAVLFSVLLYFPESLAVRKPFPGVVYEVDLVEMPGDSGAAKTPAPAEKEAESTPKAEAPEPGPKAVSLPEKKTARRIEPIKNDIKPVIVAKRTAKTKTTPVKKKEVSASELIDRAISKIDRKVKAEAAPKKKTPTQGNHLEKALASLEAKAGEDSGSRGSGEGRSGAGGVAGTVMQIYQAKVHNWISSNWSYPTALSRDKDLEVIIVLDVQRDGRIVATRIASRSSDPVFDESVIRAIERSDPLPPFPDVYRRNHDEFEIRFNLDELDQS